MLGICWRSSAKFTVWLAHSATRFHTIDIIPWIHVLTHCRHLPATGSQISRDLSRFGHILIVSSVNRRRNCVTHQGGVWQTNGTGTVVRHAVCLSFSSAFRSTRWLEQRTPSVKCLRTTLTHPTGKWKSYLRQIKAPSKTQGRVRHCHRVNNFAMAARRRLIGRSVSPITCGKLQAYDPWHHKEALWPLYNSRKNTFEWLCYNKHWYFCSRI